jgi:membrane-associated phospholipid phosphatase
MPLVLLALLLGWAAMLLFGGMELDRALLLLLYSGDRPVPAMIARALTELGGWSVLLPATAVGTALLLWRREWRSAALLAGITLSGRLLVEGQKIWIGRPRPEVQNHMVDTHSLSFPSAHAANSTMVWICLALLLPRTPGQRTGALWAAVWLAIAIGVTRPMLGVHWPSDVIGGWTFGLFWILLWLGIAGFRLDGPVSPS